MITLVIYGGHFEFCVLKNPQGLETQIRRNIITRMLEMHNQPRKKVYQPKQGYPKTPHLAAGLCCPSTRNNGQMVLYCQRCRQ